MLVVSRLQDHPRIRGEHAPSARRSSSRLGSSPHTRGAHQERFRRHQRRRIIPAYAGSTFHLFSFVCLGADHPRIRGEHPLAEIDPRQICGSSPHTRGAHLRRRRRHRRSRIIPAYAGSTARPPQSRRRRRDHPRIRGEHYQRVIDGLGPAGSSPHTRGARRRRPAWRRRSGIIPAYAGSTGGALRRPGATRDHPRIRGEHLRGAPRVGGAVGSSPHTRGAPRHRAHLAQRQRIIPAYAGSTRFWCRRRPRDWDHPRIRGEHAQVSTG